MSTVIGFRFVAGRYHATPWGAHVNEAAVEWPPSPWRVLRGLIAVWHRKVHPEEIGEVELERLILALSGSTVRYRLPAAVHAHSRHYMPIRDGKGEKKTLVFDAFARVRPIEELVMVWSDVSLDDQQQRHLALLLHRLGYLGRAESWVEARLHHDWNGDLNCSPMGRNDPSVDAGLETFKLSAPVASDTYSAWRDEQIVRRDLDREKLRKKEEALKATLPERLIDALRLDTGDVRAQGWSRPPGLEWVQYGRAAGALRGGTATRTIAPDEGSAVTTARLILKGKPLMPKGSPLPPIEDAIRIGEVTRAAVMSAAERVTRADQGIPAVVSGHGMGDDNVHGHAFYLPEDADGDGRIDHIVVHADDTLDDVSLAALAAVPKIWVDRGTEWEVIFEASGTGDSLSDHPYLASSTTWVSVTPYLHPWHRKKNFNVADQIRRECQARGLPEPTTAPVDTLSIRGRRRRPVHFHRFRTRGRRRARQPDTQGSFWTLTFPEPVRGPIALGFGCHFGLGMFRSARMDDH